MSEAKGDEKDLRGDRSDRDAASESADQTSLRHLPDVRDGLTRLERIVLWQLSVLEKERRGRMVPTAQLYGRVVEHIDVSEAEFMRTMQRLMGTWVPR